MAENRLAERSGWVSFAGYLIIVVGVVQAISGLTALLNDKFYLVTKDNLAVFDFTTWGWVHLILGGVLLMTGTAILSGLNWGRVAGVVFAMLSIVVNFAFVTAYPLWSILAITLDVLVIYGLAVRGSET